jgi:hypothetical protein
MNAPGVGLDAIPVTHFQLVAQQLKWAVELTRMGGYRTVFSIFFFVLHLLHPA